MRCTYCYAPPEPSRAMPFAVVRRTLDLATRLAPDRPSGISLFGGEPLLLPDLVRDVVLEAEDRQERGLGRFHVKITTNGLALDDAFLAFAAEHGLQIALSFDGIREAHDRHRRMPDGGPSFDRLLPRLRALLVSRPYSPVLMVVTPDTVSRYADSVASLLDEGVRYVIASLDHAPAWDEAALDALEDQCRRLADLYLAWTRAGRKFFFSPFEVKIASHVVGPRMPWLRCLLGRRQVSVDPGGWIYPCVQFTRAGAGWRIGHVESGFDEAARTRVHALADAPREPCDRCPATDRCLNTCACLNRQATGDVARVPAVLCRYERVLLPLADRVAADLFAEGHPHFLAKHYDPLGPLRSLIQDMA